ncbi:MAG: hypothetical protein KCHDKBKB_01916 [Elusimicrobia bacterium]|nr:hypothetical protein [Elusimicrobiota bacterium]
MNQQAASELVRVWSDSNVPPEQLKEFERIQNEDNSFFGPTTGFTPIAVLALGSVGFALHVLYVVAGVQLFRNRLRFLELGRLAVGGGILFTLARGVLLANLTGANVFGMVGLGFIAMVLDTVLLVLISLSKRSAAVAA